MLNNKLNEVIQRKALGLEWLNRVEQADTAIQYRIKEKESNVEDSSSKSDKCIRESAISFKNVTNIANWMWKQ